jgi:two-component sensor histidine kinase
MAEDSVVGQGAIEIRVIGDLGEVTAGVATPLAVVIAELIQNALEHGFGDQESRTELLTGSRTGSLTGEGSGGNSPEPSISGHIDLVLRGDGPSLSIQVRDDGVGLPPGFDIERTNSLGLSIVRDLVESQLNGKIAMSSGPGTVVDISVVRDPDASDHAW